MEDKVKQPFASCVEDLCQMLFVVAVVVVVMDKDIHLSLKKP